MSERISISRIVGINIKLNGPASILFNGKDPNFANVGIYFYTYSFKGLEDMTFTFTRAKR